MKSIVFIFLLCLTLNAKDTIPILKKTSKQDTTKKEPLMVQPKPYVATLDTYGSDRVTIDKVRQLFGKKLDKWIEMGLKGDIDSLKLEMKLADEIKKKFDLADASWSIVQTFEPGDLAFHIILDVVEKKDVEKRKPFYEEPTKKFEDPDGLIKSWMLYEGTALRLVEAQIIDPDTMRCPAFHCPFGHAHEDLKKYESIFVNGVKKNANKLIEIQKNDQRVEFRASATYLLAYLKDGKKVVELMLDRIRDPEPIVRNNALRVLGDIAEYHKEYAIPIKPMLHAMDFPRISDRQKSMYVVYQLLLTSPSNGKEVKKHSLLALFKILKSKMPDTRELAYDILKKVSGLNFSINDEKKWEDWINAELSNSKKNK